MMWKKLLATTLVLGLIGSGTAAFAAEKPAKSAVKLTLEQRAAKFGVLTSGLSKKQIKAAVQVKKAEHKAAKAAKKAARAK